MGHMQKSKNLDTCENIFNNELLSYHDSAWPGISISAIILMPAINETSTTSHPSVSRIKIIQWFKMM